MQSNGRSIYKNAGKAEIETKIIDINPADVRARLKELGARFVKRVNYRILLLNLSGPGRKREHCVLEPMAK